MSSPHSSNFKVLFFDVLVELQMLACLYHICIKLTSDSKICQIFLGWRRKKNNNLLTQQHQKPVWSLLGVSLDRVCWNRRLLGGSDGLKHRRPYHHSNYWRSLSHSHSIHTTKHKHSNSAFDWTEMM